MRYGGGMLAPYYQDESVTIYHGDCREIVPALGKFDLLLTDPPYGIKRFQRGIGNGDRMVNKSLGTTFNNNVPTSAELIELIGITAEACIWGMNNLELPVTEHFLVWDKEQTVDNFASAELAWCNFKKPAKIFRYAIHSHNHTKQGGHPTEKPLQLMTWCISLADNPQTILDPFAGSGTTGRAAKDLGRKAVLIEIEERYCEITASRMAQEVFDFANSD